jgi:hypothetical protein
MSGPAAGDNPAPEPAGRGCASPLQALLVGVLLVLVLGTGVLVGRACAPPPAPPDSVTVIRPSADVVTAIRDLSRLESAQYHVERVLDLTDKQTRLFGLIEAKDAILLVAAGDVTAGIDLAELGPGDVVADPEARRARIVLPPPKILSAKLDNERTYVHTRTTDTLARRAESLETRARQEAERSIEEAARASGILERAGKNAARTVESLVRALGYTDVEVTLAKQ